MRNITNENDVEGEVAKEIAETGEVEDEVEDEVVKMKPGKPPVKVIDKEPMAFAFSFGCHGGEHRSVSVAYAIAEKLEKEKNWKVFDKKKFRVVVRHMNVQT